MPQRFFGDCTGHWNRENTGFCNADVSFRMQTYWKTNSSWACMKEKTDSDFVCETCVVRSLIYKLFLNVFRLEKPNGAHMEAADIEWSSFHLVTLNFQISTSKQSFVVEGCRVVRLFQ